MGQRQRERGSGRHQLSESLTIFSLWRECVVPGFAGRGPGDRVRQRDVAFWHKADLAIALSDVRFRV
jgi:hypothetical protein